MKASYSAPRTRVLAQAEIERIVEQRLVVGADVERDRQRQYCGGTPAQAV